MKKFINFLVVVGYIWLTLTVLYTMVIPYEIREKIPMLNNFGFLFTGISAGTISLALQYVKRKTLDSELNTYKSIYNLKELIDRYNEEVKGVKDVVLKQNDNITNLNQERIISNENLLKLIKQNDELKKQIDVLLKSKATNPFIDLDLKDEISEVLGDED